MLRYITAALLLVLVICVIYAPASLLRHLTASVPGMEIVGPSGTLWNGSGGLVVQGELLGTAQWAFAPLQLFNMEVSYAVSFQGRDTRLTGNVSVASNGLTGTATGTVGTNSLNYTLEPWDVRVDTPVTVEHIVANWDAGALDHLDGVLSWSGGTTTWLIDGVATQTSLPPLRATLGSVDGALSGIVLPDGGQVPVLQFILAPDGTFTLKISKLLTRMVGRPWPGGDPDHAIVMEMIDDLF